MNSCHEEGVRDQDRAGIEAADPARTGSAFPQKWTDVHINDSLHFST
eukprot:gene26700-biopygen17174